MWTHHAGCAPDVGGGGVAGAHQHLQGAVLPGLDVVCEVFGLRGGRRLQDTTMWGNNRISTNIAIAI